MVIDTKSLTLTEKILLKHQLINEIADEEFSLTGFKLVLEEKGIKFKLIRPTPLGKNPYGFGIKKRDFELVQSEELVLIIAIMDKRQVDKHIFYIFNKDYLQFLSGKYGNFQYVNFRIKSEKEEFLPTISEFLNLGDKGDKSI